VDNLEGVLTRVENRADDIGADVDSEIAAAADAIDTAQRAIADQAGKDYTVDITDEEAARAAVEAARAELRADLAEVKAYVEEARSAVRAAVSALKDADTGNDAEGAEEVTDDESDEASEL